MKGIAALICPTESIDARRLAVEKAIASPKIDVDSSRSRSMRSRKINEFLMLFLLTTIFATTASAQGLIVVDYAKLDRYWRAEPALVIMEVGNSREEAFGCITVGFLIDRGGRMAAVRPLRRAFGKSVPPRRARELTMAVTNAAPMLANYASSAENPKTAEVFTALTIPIIGRKLSAGMSHTQKEAVAAQLRPSCEILDLVAWIDAHDMRKEPVIEIAPEIDSAKNDGAQKHVAR
jgi:hypothetical protein